MFHTRRKKGFRKVFSQTEPHLLRWLSVLRRRHDITNARRREAGGLRDEQRICDIDRKCFMTSSSKKSNRKAQKKASVHPECSGTSKAFKRSDVSGFR